MGVDRIGGTEVHMGARLANIVAIEDLLAQRTVEGLTMNVRLWAAPVLISILLSPIGIQAQEQPEKTANGLRREVLELKQLILQLTTRLEEVDRRLSLLEKRIEPGTDGSTKMRRLGSRLMVDENGTIWNYGRPVGYWGVNGDISVDRR